RAAEGASELVVTKRIWLLAGGVGKEIRRVHGVIPEKFKKRSAPLVTARVRLQVNDTSRNVTKLSGISAGLYRKFTHCVERDVETIPPPLRGGCDGDPVDEEQVGFGPLSVHVDRIRRPAFPGRARIDTRT